MGRDEDEKLKADEAKKDKKAVDDDKGMQWDRECTDMLCFVLFAAFIVAMIGVCSYGFSEGDPMKLVKPFDDQGRACGEGALADYKYKFLNNLLSNNPTLLYNATCVKSCPQQGKVADCKPTWKKTSCQRALYDSSTEFVPNYCLPTGEDLQKIIKMIYAEVNKQGPYAKYLQDLQNGWKPIAIMCGGSFLVAFIYVFLLKWIVKPLLYISMLLILVMFIGIGAFCFIHAKDYKEGSDEQKYNHYAAIVSWCIAAAYLCCMCCCWKNISLGANIMVTASEFVTSNIKIIFLPIIAYFLSVIVFVMWIYSAVYVWSVGTSEYRAGQIMANIKWKKETEYIMWGYLFGLLWIVSFIICMQQFIIAVLTCMWYFSGQGANSDSPGEVSIMKAIGWGMWYHLGSVSFGAFLIALITFIRIIFEYMAKKHEAIAGKDNVVVKAITCCMRCVLWCLDKYVKFITKNAFIQIAINSMNFCGAAWESFYLVIRHAGRFGSAGMIGFIMMLLGKGVIMGASAWITFLLTKYQFKEVQQPFIPALFVGLFSYLVGSLFLSIFSFSCTAILHCFITDEDRGGRKDRTPESLQKFIDIKDQEDAKKSDGGANKGSGKGETEMQNKMED